MTRIILLLVFTALALGVHASIATAQDAAARIVSVDLSPTTATVGDQLTLTIVVEHARDLAIEGPGFDAAFGGLELVEIAQPETETRDGGARTTLRYTLTPFATGTFTVPALTITYRGDTAEGALTTDPRDVVVETVLSPGDDRLRGLKPQLGIEGVAPTPLLPATVVALFAVLTAFGYWLLSRAMAPKREQAAAPGRALTPYEAAVADLDALADGAEDVGARYAAIAAIVRRYLSARFDFGAYAMTRRELERGMTRTGIDRWPARLTANLLEQCDAVQFAGFVPAAERVDADLTAAYEIIELTRPVSAPPAAAAVAPA